MSFEAELQDAVVTALSEIGDANGVHLERPVRASVPYFVLGELIAVDWSVKGARGREVRLLVRAHDEGESWTRAAALLGAASRAVEQLPRQLGDWRLGSVTFLRSRTLRDGSNGWVGTVEYRIRAMEI